MNRNARLGLICAVAFVSMVGVAYAAVPLYKRFCQLTGFDGATRRAAAASAGLARARLWRRVAVAADMATAPWAHSRSWP